jgi:hypothetical protein
MNTYQFTAPQLGIMSDTRISESEMNMFMAMAIHWDECDRPRHQWITYEEWGVILNRTHDRNLTADIRMLRMADLLATTDTMRLPKACLSDEGMAAAEYILDAKDGRRYIRLMQNQKNEKGDWRQVYTPVAWANMLAAFRAHIIKVDVRAPESNKDRTKAYIDVKQHQAAIDHMKINSRTYNKEGIMSKAPKILLDKIAMFKGKDMPAWLHYDIEQFKRNAQ